MAYEPSCEFFQIIGYWQTLIAGLLAVAAGVATIVVTKQSADREVRAAQAQIDSSERIEKRRLAREGFSTLAFLDAALEVSQADYQDAMKLSEKLQRGNFGFSRDAAEARTAFRTTGFKEISSRLVTHGGRLTKSFLDLQRDIEEFGSKLQDQPTAGSPVKWGASAGLHEDLDRIGIQIRSLRDEVAEELKQCNEILAN